MKFKLGDFVICLDGSEDWLGDNKLKAGEVHNVTRVTSSNNSIGVSNHSHPAHYNFAPERFMKIKKVTKLLRLVFE